MEDNQPVVKCYRDRILAQMSEINKDEPLLLLRASNEKDIILVGFAIQSALEDGSATKKFVGTAIDFIKWNPPAAEGEIAAFNQQLNMLTAFMETLPEEVLAENEPTTTLSKWEELKAKMKESQATKTKSDGVGVVSPAEPYPMGKDKKGACPMAVSMPVLYNPAGEHGILKASKGPFAAICTAVNENNTVNLQVFHNEHQPAVFVTNVPHNVVSEKSHSWDYPDYLKMPA